MEEPKWRETSNVPREELIVGLLDRTNLLRKIQLGRVITFYGVELFSTQVGSFPLSYLIGWAPLPKI